MHNLEGGCLCGAIQYQISSKPIDAGYCHCRLCQRSSGAPALAWLTVPVVDFRYTQGQPKVFHSSPDAQREFCASCGTQIVFRPRGAEALDITVASLNEPDQVPPEYHIWRHSKIAWFETTDAAPRHEDAGPDL